MKIFTPILDNIFLGYSCFSAFNTVRLWRLVPFMVILTFEALILTGCTGTPEDSESLLNRSKAYYESGIAYIKEEEYDRAIEDFTAALQINPNYAEALNSRGIAYALKGDRAKAIENWKDVLKIDPHNTTAEQFLEIAQ